ncbi:hypothetical protein SLA2020_029780 [Shorea laevis]
MAECVLNIVTPLIENAISKAFSFGCAQISQAWGLENELGKLARTLTMIQGVLQHAEERQESNEAVRIWLRQLGDVAYEAVDALDEYAYEVLKHKVQSQGRRKQVHTFFSLFNRPVFCLKMADKIRKINQSLAMIKENEVFVLLIGLGEQSCLITSARQYFRTDSILDCSKFVGRNDDVLKIVNVLDNMRSQHLISGISIVGLGGIGKTTLAKSICQMAKEQKLYDLVAWVCVSENFDEQMILGDMLEYIDSSAGRMNNMDVLIQKLGKELEHKNFLLVLDDVWNEEKDRWDGFESRLSKISKTTGNSILMTTRSVKVASIMERFPMHKHDVQKLSDNECWLIIKDIVLRSSTETSIPSDLEGIGQDIERQCGGLPLVASVMGGTLGREISTDKWKEIRDDRAWMSQDKNNKILSILKISFDRLPSPLKMCFSYCSIFPKDHVFRKDDLVQLWMAQGFLPKSNESLVTMEDVGSDYFNELLSNSLFQDLECDLYGNVESCKMHDLVHDLALLVSRGKTLIWDTSCNFDENSTIRHLRVESNGEVLPTIPRSIVQRLHSLFSNLNVFCGMASDLKSLRSLKLFWGGKEEELPTSLKKLKHLRYLDISGIYFKVPPRSFSELYNLQTLNANSNCLMKLPNGGANLICLRHIYSYHPFYVSTKQLTSLQTLSKFCVDTKKGYNSIEELECLSQLRGELAISHLDCVRSKFKASRANLKAKKLYKLELAWNDRDREGNSNDEEVIESLEPHSNLKSLTIKNYRGKNFPSWLVRSDSCSGSSILLNNMVELKLSHCYECMCIPSLGLLPSLKVLYIDDMPQVRRMGHMLDGRSQSDRVESITLFPALKKLEMWHMTRLEEWVEVAEDAVAGGKVEIVFPCLEDLFICNCPELKTWSIGRFSSHHKLSNLTILLCSNLIPIPSIDGLSSLKRIELSGFKGLTSLPFELGYCNSLQELDIYNVPNLISIPEDVGRLHSLTSLTIEHCEKFRIQEFLGCLPIGLKELKMGPFCKDLEEFPLPNLSSIASLESLILIGWDQLKSLPHQLQHLTTLKILGIFSFNGMEALPEWLGNLSSLQQLEIRICPNLTYLPSLEAMECLSSLEFLYALDCPKLRGRCANKSSPEWSKISHIPNIEIDNILQGKP